MSTSKQVAMSKSRNRESKLVMDPSYSTADLILLLGSFESDSLFNFEWSNCIGRTSDIKFSQKQKLNESIKNVTKKK